jgi:hypothetical protein
VGDGRHQEQATAADRARVLLPEAGQRRVGVGDLDQDGVVAQGEA